MAKTLEQYRELKRLRISDKINIEAILIKKQGYRPATTSSLIKDNFARIIVQRGSGEGRIKGYYEAVRDLKKQFKENYEPYSQKEYWDDVRAIKSIIGEKMSTEGMEDHVRNTLYERIIEGVDYGKIDISPADLDRLSTKELYEMFKEATKIKAKQKPSHDVFYNALDSLIKSRIKSMGE